MGRMKELSLDRCLECEQKDQLIESLYDEIHLLRCRLDLLGGDE